MGIKAAASDQSFLSGNKNRRWKATPSSAEHGSSGDRSERVYQDRLQTCLQLRVWGLKLWHAEKVKRAHQIRSKGAADKQRHKVTPTNQKDKSSFTRCADYIYTHCTYFVIYTCIVRHVTVRMMLPFYNLLYQIWILYIELIKLNDAFTQFFSAFGSYTACVASLNPSHLSTMVVCSSSASSTDCCRLVYAHYPFMRTHW